jgi:lipopolysaccharide/colanic/teichoic acid biosynthesis glycosyltransferase
MRRKNAAATRLKYPHGFCEYNANLRKVIECDITAKSVKMTPRAAQPCLDCRARVKTRGETFQDVIYVQSRAYQVKIGGGIEGFVRADSNFCLMFSRLLRRSFASVSFRNDRKNKIMTRKTNKMVVVHQRKDPDPIEAQRETARATYPTPVISGSPGGNQPHNFDVRSLRGTGRDCKLDQVLVNQAVRARRSRTGVSGGHSTRYQILKRSLDIALCVAVLPVALPILAVSTLAVRLTSSGPVLFVQQRTGRGGKPFSIYKIRTMVADAELQKAALKEQGSIDGPDFKLTDDPRVTRVGAFLRKTSLDELPQLWNVLNGDMSLVGPRPTSFGMDAYERWHTERLEVQPGVTGLWQISLLRGDTNFCERVRLDISYVRERSFSTDLLILLRTVPSVLMGRGAF